MKAKTTILFLLGCCALSTAVAQEDGTKKTKNNKKQQQIVVVEDVDQIALRKIDYENIQLPPLSELFENARETAPMELLEKKALLERKLVEKEKRSWLSFFNAHGSYTYGMLDNYASSSDVLTPIYYQYSGTEQHYWNVGGSVSIPLETLFDLGGKVRRQKINADIAELEKEQQFQLLKQQIVTLYVKITNNLIALQSASENAAAYRGAGLIAEQRFRNNQMDVTALADVKRFENGASQTYQDIMTQITTDILILEILTNTPIITNLNSYKY